MMFVARSMATRVRVGAMMAVVVAVGAVGTVVAGAFTAAAAVPSGP
jgi:hypothetical protein